jgi:hypothetical protein
MPFGIDDFLIGTAVSAGAGGLGQLFGGSQGPTFQPSETMEGLTDYGLKQLKASPTKKKQILSQFKAYRDQGNRGGGEAYLEGLASSFSNPEFIEKRLAKSYQKPVNYGEGGYWDVANQLYQQQGIGFSGEEFGSFLNQAKASGIRSPQAFEDMLRKNMIASGKVMTPQQEMLSNIFGTAERDPATGKLTGRYGSSRQPVQMPNIPAAVTYQYGA